MLGDDVYSLCNIPKANNIVRERSLVHQISIPALCATHTHGILIAAALSFDGVLHFDIYTIPTKEVLLSIESL